MRKPLRTAVRFAFLVALVVVGVHANDARARSGAACSAPEYHSFDFWLGDWDVFEKDGGSAVAHVRVTSILGGCAVREQYQGTDGSAGESLSSWDPAHRVWRQYWTSNTGEIVAIEGNLHAGAMVLMGPEEGTNRPGLVRGVWQPEKDGVRESAVRSRDGGKTWAPWFALHFRKAR
ncbi:MAG: hypothetical protein WBH45_11230 [Acidobacteriaceae bacterium]